MSREINCKAVLKDNAISCKASLGQTVIVTEGPETYTGPVTVTPTEAQQTLLTKDKMLTNNVTVNPVPSEYVIPTGTEEINIMENGTVSRNVTNKASVTVSTNVPIPPGYIVPTGNLEIMENGQYDVTAKASVTVNVPVPVPTASVYSGSFTPSEDTLGPSFDIGGSDFSHFFVFASTDVDRIQSRRAFVSCYTEFGEKDIFNITTNNSGALTIPRYLTDKWFVKDGQTVICTNAGASGGGNTGYWLGSVTYNWFAW